MQISREELIPLIREFPDRSIRWLLETPDNLYGLLLVVIGDLAKNINYSKVQLVNRTFIQDNFRKREADMLFIAPFSEESKQIEHEVLIYILIEHQSFIDPTMPFRILSYMVRIWETQRQEFEENNIPLHQWRFRPILPVVFYTGNEMWNTPLDMRQLVDLPTSLEEIIPHHKTFFLNLKATSVEQLTKEDHPFGWILNVIQKEDATANEFLKSLYLAIDRLEQMTNEDQANWRKLIHFILALIFNRRDRSEHDEFFKIIENRVTEKTRKEEVQNMGKTLAQELIEEGEIIGRKNGIIIAKQEDLIRLLKGKFGSVPQELIGKIESIQQVEKLDGLFDHAIFAKTINELEIK